MMTIDEVIEMAKRVVGNYEYASYWPFFTEELQHFAKLVAAKEREACAKLIEDYKYWLGRTAKEDIASAIRARGNQECCGNPFKCEGNCVEHCADKVQP